MTEQRITADTADVMELAYRAWDQRLVEPAPDPEPEYSPETLAADNVRAWIAQAIAGVNLANTADAPNKAQLLKLRYLLERATIVAMDYEVRK